MKTIGWTAIIGMTLAGALAADPAIVAHRGASRDAPENTLPAFELAWERGADAIEGDFRLTKDGVIVCIHDKDTKRTTGLNKRVRESTFAELRRLDAGAWRGEAWKGTVIPTLEEVLATVPDGKQIYIEIKCGPEIVPTLLREVAKSGLEDEEVVFISFDAAVVGALKRRAPEIEAYWLSSFKRAKLTGKVTPTLPKVLEVLKASGADGIGSGKDNIGAEFITRILEAGFEHHVWTVDDPALGKRFEEWGAMSITTNVPGLMREKLEEDGEQDPDSAE